MIQAQIMTANANVIQMVRQDEMFEYGKGIMVMWPQGGLTMVSFNEKNGDRDGLEYLLTQVEEMCPSVQEYKIVQAYNKLKLVGNYSSINVKVRN